jgi:hypothetical protein
LKALIIAACALSLMGGSAQADRLKPAPPPLQPPPKTRIEPISCTEIPKLRSELNGIEQERQRIMRSQKLTRDLLDWNKSMAMSARQLRGYLESMELDCKVQELQRRETDLYLHPLH